jgi:probable HAF family extracellular repeat protein
VFSHRTYTPIDPPGSSISQAEGINNRGDVVGVFSDDAGNHGFLLRRGQLTTIDKPPAGSTTGAFGINDRGSIVGFQFNEVTQHTSGWVLS